MAKPKRLLSVQSSPAIRPRARRALSAFLKLHQELIPSLIKAEERLKVFEAARVERVLRSGQSDDAEWYLERFLTPISVEDRSRLSSLLLMNVRAFRILSKIAAGGQEGETWASLFADPSERDLQSSYGARLHKAIALLSKDHPRASTLWDKVKREIVDRIMDLVARCPELQDEVTMPRKGPLLWDALPHGLQQCPSRCRKTTNRAPTDVLIRKFARMRLLSVQGKIRADHSRNESPQSAAPNMKIKRTAPQSAILEGVPHTPNLHHIPPSMASLAKTSGISSY